MLPTIKDATDRLRFLNKRRRAGWGNSRQLIFGGGLRKFGARERLLSGEKLFLFLGQPFHAALRTETMNFFLDEVNIVKQ